jgi:GT2 family glycosyltransferase
MISIVVISKDEPALDETLNSICAQARALREATEVIVVDASQGRLASIAARHPEVNWIDYEQPPGVSVSIPHQRNVGVRAARGDVVVFSDAGCYPAPGWLPALVAPIHEEDEDVVAGAIASPGDGEGLYDSRPETLQTAYRRECPSGNVAFRRLAFDAVGGFDEQFEYGSDIEFSWRLVDAGFRIRSTPEAVVAHDWGSGRRQVRRAYVYGRARARLYLKHRRRLRSEWRRDPMVLVYPAFILGLPLTFVSWLYPALLVIPAWRNRREGGIRVLADHLAFGFGVLSEVVSR